MSGRRRGATPPYRNQNSGFLENSFKEISCPSNIQNEDFDEEIDDMKLKQGEEYYGPCNLCGNKATFLCICKSWYCSKDCQLAHWSEHWKNCHHILKAADPATVPLNWREINRCYNWKSNPQGSRFNSAPATQGQSPVWTKDPLDLKPNYTVSPTNERSPRPFYQNKSINYSNEFKEKEYSRRNRSKSEIRSKSPNKVEQENVQPQPDFVKKKSFGGATQVAKENAPPKYDPFQTKVYLTRSFYATHLNEFKKSNLPKGPHKQENVDIQVPSIVQGQLPNIKREEARPEVRAVPQPTLNKPVNAVDIAKVQSPPQEKTTSSNSSNISKETPPTASDFVKVVHIASPSSFFIQRVKDEANINSIGDTLQQKCEAGTISLPNKGDLCAALFEEVWYRALVTDVKNNKCRVHYIDFGNEDVVEFNCLSELPELALKKIPKKATHCTLYGVAPVVNEWSETEIEFFHNLIVDDVLTLDIVTEERDVVYAKLIDRVGMDVGTALIGSGNAVASLEDLPGLNVSSLNFLKMTDQLRTGAEIQIINPIFERNYFWGQLMKNASEYDQFNEMEKRINAAEPKSIESVKPGQEVVAFSPSFEVWYRAKVLEILSSNKLQVFYIDYGNTEEVTKYGELQQAWKIPSPLFRFSIHSNQASLKDDLNVGTVTNINGACVCIIFQGDMKVEGHFNADLSFEKELIKFKQEESSSLVNIPQSPIQLSEDISELSPPIVVKNESVIPKLQHFQPSVGDKVSIISYGFDSFSFSATFEKDMNHLKIINQVIKDFMKQQDDTEIVTLSLQEIFLAKNNLNHSWSRVALLNYDSVIAEAYLLDYGVIEHISTDSIRYLSKDIQKLPILCNSFRFEFNIPDDNAEDIFTVINETLPIGRPFEARIVAFENNEYHIQVPSLTQLLINKSLVF